MYKLQSNNQSQDICFRTFEFSKRILKLVLHLPKNTAGFTLGDQLLRSGTSIGANLEEAQNCGTKKDFIHTLTISLKEARETHYWLRLIAESSLINKDRLNLLITENIELIKILTAIIKNSKKGI